MDPISRLGRMMGLARTARGGKTRQGRSQARAAGSAGQHDMAAAEMPGVRALIAARLQGLDLDTPQGQRRGCRVFLEAVFRDELGEAVMASPRFNDIVSEVLTVLSDDVQIREEWLALLREMQRNAT